MSDERMVTISVPLSVAEAALTWWDPEYATRAFGDACRAVLWAPCTGQPCVLGFSSPKLCDDEAGSCDRAADSQESTP